MPIYHDEENLIYLYRPDASGLEPSNTRRQGLPLGLSVAAVVVLLVLL